jgi:hypothetical protein
MSLNSLSAIEQIMSRAAGGVVSQVISLFDMSAE